MIVKTKTKLKKKRLRVINILYIYVIVLTMHGDIYATFNILIELIHELF